MTTIKGVTVHHSVIVLWTSSEWFLVRKEAYRFSHLKSKWNIQTSFWTKSKKQWKCTHYFVDLDFVVYSFFLLQVYKLLWSCCQMRREKIACITCWPICYACFLAQLWKLPRTSHQEPYQMFQWKPDSKFTNVKSFIVY